MPRTKRNLRCRLGKLSMGEVHFQGRNCVVSCLVFGAAAILCLVSTPAYASSGQPQWTATAVSRPTNFMPADDTGEDAYVVTITNSGSAATDGTPITITDELPQGLALAPSIATGKDQLSNSSLSCVLRTCTFLGVVVPDDTLVVSFPVNVLLSQPTSVTNVVRVAGGGASDAFVVTPTTISTTPAGFGVSPGGYSTALSSTQAGAHADLTTSIAFNTTSRNGSLAGDPKDTVDDLPPGFAGDLVDTPECSGGAFAVNDCPIDTQVGIETVTLDLFGRGKLTLTNPVYDLIPNTGELAKFGFFAATGIPIEGNVSLRPEGYGIEAAFRNINDAPVEVDNVSLTVWGVPAAAIHDPLRWVPGQGGEPGKFGASVTSGSEAPFLTNPTACAGQSLNAIFGSNSWEQSDEAGEETVEMPFGPLVGCDRLGMDPSLTVEATTDKVSAPTGLDLTLKIPQTYEDAGGLATSTLKRAVVMLPEGMTVNPSAGAGLTGCTPSEYAEEGIESIAGVGCPSSSRLGSVRIESPAVKEAAVGSVFIAQPYDNQFKSLLALYVVARIGERGVLIKSAGDVTADAISGRLTTTFDDLPPLPFSHLTFEFSQGQTSPLVTPPSCGNYSAGAELTPWSEPAQVLTPVLPAFSITEGFEGGPCPSGLPRFEPQVLAGTAQNEAGAFSPMYIRLIRADGEQEITRFSARLPVGLTADLTGVPFCSDADISYARGRSGAEEEANPSCPSASYIGHTLVGAGVGSVLAYASGRVYMAGPYNGAPFSIVAITSAKVGPFDLGTVVVREALRIDPTTAAVTVDASASDPIPHIIKGIVVHVRDIRVYIDRPNFTLNPTSCESMRFLSTIGGAGVNFESPSDDVAVTVADRFQAADCRDLTFKPAFEAATAGNASRARGASLTVKLSYPSLRQGTQANIRAVKVDLPRQLPSRLSTLQKACAYEAFSANPATCPAASRVGVASAVTPILPVPLRGPAYFVSHGGAKFPELIIVLQGYGVSVELHGETFISRSGITSSTFRSVPDEPVKRFELTLPQGPNSALAAIGVLCKKELKMPTTFTAQNGAVFRQTTAIAVRGCGKNRRKASQRK